MCSYYNERVEGYVSTNHYGGMQHVFFHCSMGFITFNQHRAMRKYKPWCMHKICIQPRACVIMCFYIFLAHLHVCSRRVLGTWSSPIRNALIHPLRGIFVAGSHGDPVSGLHGYANEIVVTMQSLPTGCTKDIKLFILKESERRIQNT